MPASDLELLIGAQVGGALGGIQQVTGAVEGMASTVNSITSVFTGAAEVFAAAFAVDKIKEFINNITELGAQVQHLSQELGISTEEVSAFEFAAEAMGESGESAAMAMVRLERNMSQAQKGVGPAESAFRALGISVLDSTGHMKGLDEIMPEIAEKFAAAADGPEKTAIAMALLGRAGAQMIPLLDLGAAGLEAMRVRAEETGTVLSGPAAKGMEDTAINITTLGKSIEGVSITIYEAFKPAIDAIINGLIEFFESCNNAMKGTGGLNVALAGIVQVVDVFVNAIMMAVAGLKTLWTITMTTIQDIVTAWNTLGQVMYDVLTGNWSSLSDDYNAGMEKLKSDTIAGTQDIIQTWMKYLDQEKGLMSNTFGSNVDTSGGSVGAGMLPHPGHEKKPLAEMTPKAKSTSEISEWRDQLQQKIQLELGFFKDSTQMEIDFWEEKLKTLNTKSKEYLEVSKLLYDAQKKQAQEGLKDQVDALKQKQDLAKGDFQTQIAIQDQIIAIEQKAYGDDVQHYGAAVQKKADLERQWQSQKNAMALEANNTERTIEQLKLQNQVSVLDQEVAAGQITAVQKLQMEQTLQEQIYQLEVQGYKDELALEDLSQQEKQKINDKMEVAEAKHQLTMQNLANQTTLAEQHSWDSFFNTIGNSFDQMLTGILQGTQTFNQAIGRMLGNLIISFLEADAKRLLHWIATELSMTQASVSAAAVRNAADREGQGTASAEHVASALQSIATDAAKAYASVYAWAAPVLGPFAAVPAAAAAAVVFGAEALIPSAAGGMVLDSDSLVQAHEDEMILPAQLSRGIQGIIESGQTGGGGTNHFHVHTVDTYTMEQWLNQHGMALASVVSGQFKSNPGLRPKV